MQPDVWRCPGCGTRFPSLPKNGCCAGLLSVDAELAAAEIRRLGRPDMTAERLRALEADPQED